MNASRELDALISEKIFRIPVDKDDNGYWPPPLPGQNFSTQEIPHYSYSLKDAWEIAEEMRSVRCPEDDAAVFTIWLENRGGYFAGWSWHENEYGIVRAETAPLAICLAALKAVGVSVPEEA